MDSLEVKIFKHRIKTISIALIYLSVVFWLAYIFNKTVEALSFILTYTIIRDEFNKAIHGSDFTNSAYKGNKYCRIITFAVQVISLLFIIAINISKYVDLALSFALGIINFFAKDYLECKLVKNYNINHIEKEKLISLCEKANLTAAATNRMIKKYVEHKTYQEIAVEEYVDINAIKLSINRSRKRLKI